MSQGDIEKRTGLLRCYVSRVENGHTVPAIETVEKFARALEVPIYQLFYDGEEPPAVVPVRKGKKQKDEFGDFGKNARLLDKFRRLLAKMNQHDRDTLLFTARKMVNR